jgi:hypothetical protein
LNSALKMEIEGLRRMTVAQLRRKHMDLFGEEIRSNHKEFLFKRIAWRMQAMAEGGLSERAQRRAMELANDADLRVRAPKNAFADDPASQTTHTAVWSVNPTGDPRLPMAGAIITREFKGRTISVGVRETGFEFDGKIYRSLSSIAREVTGTKWNGFTFFGLSSPQEAPVAQR